MTNLLTEHTRGRSRGLFEYAHEIKQVFLAQGFRSFGNGLALDQQVFGLEDLARSGT